MEPDTASELVKHRPPVVALRPVLTPVFFRHGNQPNPFQPTTTPPTTNTLAARPSTQGDLSLDHYDDSHHSRGSLGGLIGLGGGGGGIGALGIANGGLSIRASSGFPRENSGGAHAGGSSAAPWGSGMGGGKGEAGGAGGQHLVVPGGIWLPTPRTQGTSSFSPSSSTGGGGGGAGGGAGGAARERAAGDRGGGEGGSGGKNAANGGFFGSDEPRCARCSNTDAAGQAQVGWVGMGEKRELAACCAAAARVRNVSARRLRLHGDGSGFVVTDDPVLQPISDPPETPPSVGLVVFAWLESSAPTDCCKRIRHRREKAAVSRMLPLLFAVFPVRGGALHFALLQEE